MELPLPSLTSLRTWSSFRGIDPHCAQSIVGVLETALQVLQPLCGWFCLWKQRCLWHLRGLQQVLRAAHKTQNQSFSLDLIWDALWLPSQHRQHQQRRGGDEDDGQQRQREQHPRQDGHRCLHLHRAEQPGQQVQTLWAEVSHGAGAKGSLCVCAERE